jgi:hypothetical protein
MTTIQRLIVCVTLFGAGALSGCSQPAPVEDLCQRLDSCNALAAGYSVQDCVDNRNSCVDDLTSSERNDWEDLMGSCLERDSCSLFIECYLQVPWC